MKERQKEGKRTVARRAAERRAVECESQSVPRDSVCRLTEFQPTDFPLALLLATDPEEGRVERDRELDLQQLPGAERPAQVHLRRLAHEPTYNFKSDSLMKFAVLKTCDRDRAPMFK